MAWLVQRGNTFHVAFRIGNTQFRKSLRTRNRRTAESAMHRVEDNLRDLELGRIEVPEGADIATYLLSNGQRVGKVRPTTTPKLGRIFDEYKQSLPKGALEDRTLATTDIHMKHVFEQQFPLGHLSLENKGFVVLGASDSQKWMRRNRSRPTRRSCDVSNVPSCQ